MIYVKSPASCANMGPAFDCVGMALQLYNEIWVETSNELEISTSDGLDIPLDNTNLVYRSIQQFYELTGTKKDFYGVRIKQKSSIPVARGLGSSAACIVGGVLIANQLSCLKLSKDELLPIATKIEGHVDNVAPSLLGGIVAGTIDSDVGHRYVTYVKLDGQPLIDKGIKFAAIVPRHKSQTDEMRNILPQFYSREDMIFNISRTALLVAALATADIPKLKTAMEDRVHQPYRGKLIRSFSRIMEILVQNDATGAFLSGAGPTIFVLYRDVALKQDIENELKSLPDYWSFMDLELDTIGATINVYNP